MKKAALLVLLSLQPAYAAQLDVKQLKAGDATLEALGEIKSDDDVGYSAIREILCAGPGAMDGGQSLPADKSADQIPRAIVLLPGSQIIIQRSVLNDYGRRFKMKDLVKISCE